MSYPIASDQSQFPFAEDTVYIVGTDDLCKHEYECWQEKELWSLEDTYFWYCKKCKTEFSRRETGNELPNRK